MDGICYIVGAAKVFGKIKPQPCDIIIAADGGYLTVERLGLNPTLIVGDFDSSPLPISADVLTFPVHKDDTDILLAVKEGLSRGYRRFALFGGTGGRSDHTYANYQVLYYIAANGASGVLVGNKELSSVIIGSSINLTGKEKDKFSVFAIGGNASGVNIRNAEYPLENAILTTDFPLGVSNTFTDKPAVVSVERGGLLIIWQSTFKRKVL